MKIALVVPAYLPAEDYGGPVAKAVSLGGALRDLGLEVEIWTSDFGLKRTRVGSGTREVGGLTVRYLRRWMHYRWSPVVPSVVPLARRTDIDLAHLFGYRDGLTLPAAMALYRRGVPYVVEMAGMTVPRYRNLAIKVVFDRTVGRSYMTHAALVIANSVAEAHDLKSYVAPDHINLVLNPIELPDAPARQPHEVSRDGRLRVASIGRLAPVKNLDVLVRSVAGLPDVELDIVGPTDVPDVETRLKSIINSLKLGDRVRLRGPLFGADLRDALGAIDVVAMPSQSESFGNAAIEAAVQGIPVIVSDRCGVAPLIEETGAGLVVEAGSVASLADAIGRLHADRQLLAELSAAGPRLRHIVAPAEIAKQHRTRYERILAGDPPLPGPFSAG